MAYGMTAITITPPWWQESRCAFPPTRAHSGSAGGVGAICDSKTLHELTLISAASRLPDYSCNPVQNLRREPWLSSQDFRRHPNRMLMRLRCSKARRVRREALQAG